MKRTAALVVIALLAGATCGCADGASRRASAPDGSAPDSGPFAPARVEIHALTRVVAARVPGAAGGSPTIEAHIEFVDAWGFEVRALAALRFGIAGGSGATVAGEGATDTWTVDLTDPEENARRFDRVTRTYVLPLRDAPAWTFASATEASDSDRASAAGDSSQAAPSPRGVLTVEAALTDGRRLTATRRLDR